MTEAGGSSAKTGNGSAAQAEDFPLRYARTGRFRFGVPYEFAVSPDGERVVFLRSSSGRDPANKLWVHDVAMGAERLIAEPTRLLGDAAEEVPYAERVRRERAREAGGGIVAYATDQGARLAVFALSGRLWRADLTSGESAELLTPHRASPGLARNPACTRGAEPAASQ